MAKRWWEALEPFLRPFGKATAKLPMQPRQLLDKEVRIRLLKLTGSETTSCEDAGLLFSLRVRHALPVQLK